MLKVQLLSVVSSIWMSHVKVWFFMGSLMPIFLQTTQETKLRPDQNLESLTAFRPKFDQNSDQIETDADRTHQSQTKFRPMSDQIQFDQSDHPNPLKIGFEQDSEKIQT